MQYMLHNGPYRAAPQHSLSQRNPFFAKMLAMGKRLSGGYTIALKFVFIACVAFGFFQLVAYLLTLSDSLFIEILALAAWSCGAIPLIYRLWRLDLGNTDREGRALRVHVDLPYREHESLT